IGVAMTKIRAFIMLFVVMASTTLGSTSVLATGRGPDFIEIDGVKVRLGDTRAHMLASFPEDSYLVVDKNQDHIGIFKSHGENTKYLGSIDFKKGRIVGAWAQWSDYMGDTPAQLSFKALYGLMRDLTGDGE